MKGKVHYKGSHTIGNGLSTKQQQLFKTNLQIMRFATVIAFVFVLHLGARASGWGGDTETRNTMLNESYHMNDGKRMSGVKLVKIEAVTGLQQDRVITGQVIDADDAGSLVGVSIQVKGTQRGTTTDADGNFSLRVRDSDKVLVVSFMGYVPTEVPLTALIKYDVRLTRDSKTLEVVEIAFGQSTRVDLTNAVNTITAEQIEQRPISNLTSAIVGAAPGVQTSAESGEPGDGPAVRIRGFTSITNDNNPLYIVDGSPYEGVLSNINPDDIESISILKDASATALYGARAANGVVLVTTKRGSNNGKNLITARVSTALSTRALPRYEIMDAYQYYPVLWEILKNSNGNSGTYATDNVVPFVGWNPFNVSDDEIVYSNGTVNPDLKLLYPDDTGFSDELHRLGVRTDVGFTLSGGTPKTDHYVSLNYLDQQGYILGSDFKRLTGRLRVNTSPFDWLKIGLNLNANFSNANRANQSSGLGENPFYVDLVLAPIYPVYMHDPITGAYMLDANGNKMYDPGDYKPLFSGRNVIYETLYNNNLNKRNSFTAVNTTEARISKTLKFVSNFSAYINNFRGEAYDNSVMGDAVTIGRTFRTNTTQYYLNWSKILTWTKRFDKHRFNVLVGHENYHNYWDQLVGRGYGEAVDGLTILDNMTSTRSESFDRIYRTEGFLSKFDYNYNSIYVFSASFRRDGSSRFSPENRWGNFWAVSGAYNIDRENFFKVRWIDALKIRAAHGLVGNDKTGNYFTSRRLYTLNYDNGHEGGAVLTQTGNPNLQWETNLSTDIALEISTFKNRLNATIEVFRRQSDNLLFDVRLPLTSGITTMDDNFGSMRNEGIEVMLSGTPIRKQNFSWLVELNGTHFKNTILELPYTYDGLVSGTKKYEVGRSRYEFWLRDWAGINPETGGNMYVRVPGSTGGPVNDRFGVAMPEYAHLTTSTVAANAQRRYAGSVIPDVYGSITNTFTYKNWSLRVMGIFQIGGQTYDNDYQRLMVRGTAARAMHIDQLKRWQKPGDITRVAKLQTGTSSYNSTYYITDAHYFNLRMAGLTYNFSRRLLSRLKVSNAKAFVNAENIFITSPRKGMDPTQTYTGVASYSYAPSRIVSFGLNLTL